MKHKEFLVLSYAIPDEEFEKNCKKDKYPQIQTHLFIWNIIKSLEYKSENNYRYISSRPISDYPFNKNIYVKSKTWFENIDSKIIKIKEIPFINKSILKVFSRFISFFIYSLKEMINKKADGIIVYSISVPMLLVGYLVSRLFRCSLIGILTDPPSITNHFDSATKKKLRSVEKILTNILLKKYDKLIVVTKHLAEDYAPSIPYLVVDGFSNNNLIKDIDVDSIISYKLSNQITFMYTGTLEKKYGIKNITDAFTRVKNDNFKLVIYGAGEFENELKVISSLDSRIVYKGFASHNVVIKEQQTADFLINFRSPTDTYVKYSFPSKTLEYLSSGKILISSFLPCFSNEYKDAMIAVNDNSVESIEEVVSSIVNEDNNFDYVSISKRAYELAKSRTYVNYSYKIQKFISGGY